MPPPPPGEVPSGGHPVHHSPSEPGIWVCVLVPRPPNPCMTLRPNPLAPPGAARSPQTEDFHPNRPPPSLRVPSGPPQPTRASPARPV